VSGARFHPHGLVVEQNLILYSDCQKNVPFAEGFFATSAYAAILLFGTVL
jgi:hypothetical protein